jgi:hypothetical protein
MPSAYPKHLARVRAYNKTERGRAVKRAARLRQYEREKTARMNINPQPLASVVSTWSRA